METQQALIEDFEAANELISYEAGQNPAEIKVLEFDTEKIVAGEPMDPPITLKAYLAWVQLNLIFFEFLIFSKPWVSYSFFLFLDVKNAF